MIFLALFANIRLEALASCLDDSMQIRGFSILGNFKKINHQNIFTLINLFLGKALMKMTKLVGGASSKFVVVFLGLL